MHKRSMYAWACFLSVLFVHAVGFSDDLFPVPKQLQPRVEFWKKVYSQWGSDQVAFSDRNDLSLVYYVEKLPDAADRMGTRQYEKIISGVKEKIAKALTTLQEKNAQSEKNLEGFERDVFLVLKNAGKSAVTQA